MSTFTLRIVTPALAYPDREVVSVDVPAEAGRLTVLARHQPLVCLVRKGEVRIGTGSAVECWQVKAGVLRVQPSNVVLLVHGARPNAA